MAKKVIEFILSVFVIACAIWAITALSGADSKQTAIEKNVVVESWDIDRESGTTYVTGEIHNLNNTTLDYCEVDFNLYDSAGAQVGTAMDNITNLAGGGEWKFKAISTADNVDTAKFAKVSAAVY